MKYIYDIVFYNVLFVPDIWVNLISVKCIESSGNKVIFENGLVQIINKFGQTIIVGKRENNLYYLDMKMLLKMHLLLKYRRI